MMSLATPSSCAPHVFEKLTSSLNDQLSHRSG
jgi:hypothetical protein